MRLEPGDKSTPIRLPAIDGSEFDSESLRGRPYLLAFFRFAGCPFCNMRLHELVSRHDELGDEFRVVAVFDSPLDNLIRHAEGHQAPFPILADESNEYYRAYAIEKSVLGVFKGMILRLPTLMKGTLKGFIPKRIKGGLTTMPADFLIDPEGIIRVAYYGGDEGDHLPFEAIREFSAR